MTTFRARSTFQTPSYRRQRKKSGHDLAFVFLDGKRIYLGSYNSPESRARYHQIIAEWELSGRLLPSPPDQITVVEICRQYLCWAKNYYTKHGQCTTEPTNIILAIRPLLEMFEKTSAAQFGPKNLKLVRQTMTEKGWTRKHINKQVDRIKRMFKWAVAEELVPPGLYEGLRALSGLRFGRCGAPDNPPVQPAKMELIDGTRQHVNRQVAAMIDLQLLTGARPGEITIMRPCDIDRTEQIWVYRPSSHKTEHHGHERLIYIGPLAQKTLLPFLLRPENVYCFSPAEADQENRSVLTQNRITPLSCGNRAGTNRREHPRKKPGNHYTTHSYCRAIQQGCQKAFPLPSPLAQLASEIKRQWKSRLSAEEIKLIREWRKTHRWHPHQLRHNYATIVRKQYGLESAQILLGHSKADVTQVYAERDTEKAKLVALKIG